MEGRGITVRHHDDVPRYLVVEEPVYTLSHGVCACSCHRDLPCRPASASAQSLMRTFLQFDAHIAVPTHAAMAHESWVIMHDDAGMHTGPQ